MGTEGVEVGVGVGVEEGVGVGNEGVGVGDEGPEKRVNVKGRTEQVASVAVP